MDNLSEVWGIARTKRTLDLNPEQIRSIEVPVLLLTGDLSPAWFGAITNELHHLLPMSEIATIDNSSHGLYFDQPEVMDQIVLDFLKKH